jgi:hypothetical protein
MKRRTAKSIKKAGEGNDISPQRHRVHRERQRRCDYPASLETRRHRERQFEPLRHEERPFLAADRRR